MKINQITIDSVLGIKNLDAKLYTPVTVFAGDNAAGKSSVREAIKAALIGMPERVLRKRDFDQLVHDGQKTGSVVINFEGGEATFTAPKGEHNLRHNLTMDDWESQALALPYCLETSLFAAASDADRRTLLFSISGASTTAADVVTKMAEREISCHIVEIVAPLLRSGFPAAAKFSEEQCRDAKSSWRAITGETYGSVKAQTWAAPLPDVDTDKIEQLKTREIIIKDKVSTEQTRLGAAEQKLKNWLAHSANAEADQEKFSQLANLENRLEFENKKLSQWQEQVKLLEGQAGTGSRVGLVHDLAKSLHSVIQEVLVKAIDFDQAIYAEATAQIKAYESQHGSIKSTSDPEAAAKLPEVIKARDLMQRVVSNIKRDIDAAKDAGARLQQQVEKGSETEVAEIKAALAEHKQDLDQIQRELQKLQADQQAAEAAKATTDKAYKAHQDAQAWQQAINALSPTGIPAEILSTALDPVNKMLHDLSQTFDWPRVHIDSEMMITAAGRAYALLSESEKWRTNAIIALALANISGLRFVALDQFDILSLSGRADFIDGIDVLATDGFIDTALIFGTFKKLPNFEQFPKVSGFWIDNGTIENKEKVAA